MREGHGQMPDTPGWWLPTLAAHAGRTTAPNVMRLSEIYGK